MADDETQQLHRRQHELADALQKHALDLALKGQEMKTMQAEIAHLVDTRVTHEELTGALGPLRGENDLRRAETAALKEDVARCATGEQLASATALMRSDSAIIKRDVDAIQGTLTWLGRTVVGAVILAVLGLLWAVRG